MKKMFKGPWGFFRDTLWEHATPRQIACGIALGTVLGLVPKGNLTAAAIALVIFTCRVNLFAGLTSALVFTAIGAGCVDWLDRIGYAVLTAGPFQTLFARHYELPWVPWTRFNNSVVMGGLVVGLVQLLPTYYLARFVLNRSAASLS
ncbi:MAG: TIGR03546 family protein [Planctomycetales bacterium]|nr:TIGR03546 family protein [Planctomycetales bacterium]